MKNKMMLIVLIGMMLVLMTAWTVNGQGVCPPGGVDKDHPGMRCIAGLPPLIRTVYGPNIAPLHPLSIVAGEGGSGGVQIHPDPEGRRHWQPTRTPWAYP